MAALTEKTVDSEKVAAESGTDYHDIQVATIIGNSDQLKRHLGNRQIQLIAIGGSIGTAVFVTIASGGLTKGGPGSLFIAYTIYSCMMGLVNNCIAEMAVFMPISGAFIRMAGRWVDEAFGFWAGWNFFLYEVLLIPFEITALNLVLTFWRDDIPVEAVVAACIVLYFVLNAFSVKWYGEAEFWLATGKVILILIVFLFTFITMVGGNPKHDAYGFRYWNSPGAFAEHITTGPLGRFEGFLAAVWSASFTVVGPEYISMVAGETKLPRRYLKTAFKTTYARFAFFFIGSAICVGIVIPYNDKTLLDIISGSSSGSGTAAASPYVIAMGNLGISVLPHITNALLVTSIFSAGNAYTYYGTRSLYSLSLQGQAPKVLRRCTESGVPIYCLLIVSVFPFLAFLNVSSGSAKVLTWLINIITASQVIDYIIICVTYIFFYRALRAQNIDRRTLPYYGYFQPYSAWIGLIWMTMVVFVYGYTTFLPGNWSVGDFFTYYTMVLVAPVLFFGWKVVKRTKFIKPHEADLIWDRPIIDAYEASFTEYAPGFWTEVFQMFGFQRNRMETQQA
ncbi:amino acid permease/ SLC12A domain-containing protein [Talaromyces proteolyticus]|uniref:Amino acid permease/ SLC12A domain-containing protein n=1 Tax=Talaromyces proteolyticus TaxID=1131652 RepID=A0AAD4PYJ4_9EURO|nr:amino acid permease/ SLC12A domain-containing protein [Talaromyces proteolyticus]KAH8694857.1 amino acid permease/ SLC12A domain-containing protein [Talaromyces proteolyticus]